MSAPDSFYVGFAHWHTSLVALTAPLLAETSRSRRAWVLALFGEPYPLQTVPGSWVRWIYATQAGICFWCGHPVSRPLATVEHVIPQSSSQWHAMTRAAQLLSLRVSHAACNQAYAVWRIRTDPQRIAGMDTTLAHKVDRVIQGHPLLQLARYHQYQPERPGA